MSPAGRVRGWSVAIAGVVVLAVPLSARTVQSQARVSPWPCRIVVKPPLLGVFEDGWIRSETLKAQCEEMAKARTVVTLEWDDPRTEWHARTRMATDDGVVVAWIAVPPVAEAIGLVGHELQHVLERIRGVDFAAESKRPGSGVWRAVGGYETQAAIDAGRQVWREVQASQARR